MNAVLAPMAVVVLLLLLQVVCCVGQLGPTPLFPPEWPANFQVEFHEAAWYFFSITTTGKMYYDAAHNRSRTDRVDGKGNRYCGTIYPLRNTACTQLVVDGMRYIFFPEHKYCCSCCSAEAGCGILRRDWLHGAQYLGQEEVEGQMCNKWKQAGLQNNYFWETLDGVPLQIYMEPNEKITFRTETYAEEEINASLFELPPWGCEKACTGLCSVPGARGIS
ncbi:hypothetical protein KFL_002960060 [Klebsormidium nitens]|uniref:Uncharacterized protein n=1 Tax=Klebsormidium nitens TaxID=105231 RepID=A0A1Y1IBS8_KLENI|nr:hypothetical protein KFL_002960060 [Klebsormidium nitens]|eukprot:GAQ86551.1 hypothetical protein KFL_002960060 [Klebsormidium nitens]